jgi:hypothetical protein
VHRTLSRLAAVALTLVTAAVTIAGCASNTLRHEGPTRPPISGVTLLDTLILPTVTRPPGGDRDVWLGSLSGLARDPSSGRYLAVIDDRDPSRVAWLDITVRDGRLSVTPGAVTPIRPAPGIDDRAVVDADLEAIAALPDGTFVALEEGHALASMRGEPDAAVWPPVLFALDHGLQVTRVHALPARFTVGPEAGGVRDNQGFEGLTRTPDGRLIAGLEQPLHADMPTVLRNGRPFGGGRGGPGRLVEFVDDQGRWVMRREWMYPLDPTSVRAGEEICDDGENGLTELLALDATRLLVLERACLLKLDGVRNTARLYLVDTAGAADVSPGGGVPLASARPVSKRLLVDFDDLIPRWPHELSNLDNFEALAFGPALPDGSRTLIVMSDDNFRATQHTVFVWFRINEEPGTRNQEPGIKTPRPQDPEL